MGRFSDWILFPGTAAPKIREGIKNLGFAFATELEGFLSYTLPQYLSDEQKARARNNLSLGSLAVLNGVGDANWTGADLSVLNGGTGASTPAAARTNLGVAIGSNVQAYDAGLQSIAGLTTSANQMLYLTGVDTYAVASITAAGRALVAGADAAAQRTTLSTYSKAEVDAIVSGGAGNYVLKNAPAMTGNPTITTANPTLSFTRADNSQNWLVDAFSDGAFRLVDASAVAEVIRVSPSGAMITRQLGDLKTYIDTKAPLASPAFIGNPTVPNQPATDSSTRIASTATVDAKIAANSPQLFTAETSIAVNTTQQNLTGKPMAVSISRTASVNDSSGATLTATIQAGESSGSLSVRVANTAYGPNSAVISSSAMYIVPAGAYYRLTTSNSGTVTTGTTVAYSVN